MYDACIEGNYGEGKCNGELGYGHGRSFGNSDEENAALVKVLTAAPVRIHSSVIPTCIWKILTVHCLSG